MALRGEISGEQVMMIHTTIIAFYFGTQHEKKKEGAENVANTKETNVSESNDSN